MGWTYTYKQPGTSVKEFFEKEFNYDKPDEKKSGKVIAASSKFRTAYIAYEVTTGTQKQIIAIVCLLNYCPKSEYNFGYKDMDETMGPNASDCPASILDLLTETTDEHAIQWRKRCRERLEKKAKLKKVLKPGVIIKFNSPIKFTNGDTIQVFKYYHRNSFQAENGVGMYRISGWKDKEFSILS